MWKKREKKLFFLKYIYIYIWRGAVFFGAHHTRLRLKALPVTVYVFVRALVLV